MGEPWTLLRRPIGYMEPPPLAEVRRALLRSRFAVADFTLWPDEAHPANAWLYVCTDKSYGMHSLNSKRRCSVRRGNEALRVEFLSNEQVLSHGQEAFCDTRARVGLSDGTPAVFRKRFSPQACLPGHVFIGAWKDDQLAAFLQLMVAPDWCEVEGSFARTAMLSLRANDALMYFTLHHYLTEGTCKVVGHGLNSIQSSSNEVSLHFFKTKIGFQAVPVHRAFVVHPLLTPLVNRPCLAVLRRLLRLRPEHRLLKKAEGALSQLLGEGPKGLQDFEKSGAESASASESPTPIH